MVAVVFVLLVLGALTATSALTTAGGIFGIVAAAIAWYLCMAGVTATTFGSAPIFCRTLPGPGLCSVLDRPLPSRPPREYAARAGP